MRGFVTKIGERGTPAVGAERGSLPQWIYGQIRLNIMTGEYPSGMRLNEQRLAEFFEVSRVPLRESFLALQRDGFIDQLPHRSAVVTGWDAKRVNDLFDARISLEVEAARLATRRISRGGSTKEMDLMVEHSLGALHRGDRVQVAENSTRFHQLVVESTGNDLLVSLMQQIAQRMTWLFYLTSSRDSEQACHEHRELIDVMASGNEELARSIAHAHIEKGRIPSLASLHLIDNAAADSL
jgi:DNA-binding GntR family transcriptional regulator